MNNSDNSRSLLQSLSDVKSKGRISSQVIDEMLAVADIKEILEQEYDLYFDPSTNGWWNTNCPMPGHEDKSPSFGVHPESGMYNCFGCMEKGTLLTFIQKVEGLSFPEAVQRLSQITGVNMDEAHGELHRTVRGINEAIEDYLNRTAQTDLPGGMTEAAFMRAVASRIKAFEFKAGCTNQAYDFSEEVYKNLDDMMYAQDYKGLNKLWHELGKKTRFALKLTKKE